MPADSKSHIVFKMVSVTGESEDPYVSFFKALEYVQHDKIYGFSTQRHEGVHKGGELLLHAKKNDALRDKLTKPICEMVEGIRAIVWQQTIRRTVCGHKVWPQFHSYHLGRLREH